MRILSEFKLASAIEKRAESDIALCNIFGASVLVRQAGNVIYKAHFGSADQSGEPITDNSLFRLASMTKPITSVAAMILVERGLLSLDDRVDSFYPKFSSVKVYGREDTAPIKITVKDILTHSSGIASGDSWDDIAKSITDKDISSVESFVDFLSDKPLSFYPGEKQEYSGVGAFSVLTGIIQKVTDMPFPEFLKKEIFDPCLMKDTTFEPSSEEWARLVLMHDKKDGKSVVSNTHKGCVFEHYPVQNYLGGAGLISSLSDYQNFAEMLLWGGVFNGKRILSEESVKKLSTPQFYKREEESWGLGVRVITSEQNNGLPIGSFGWSGAYGTHFWIDPSNGIVAIYMKNSRFDGGSGATTSRNFEKDVYSSFCEEI